MGRKKQKVRWTTVEDGFFDSEEQQQQQEEFQSDQMQQPQRHNSESSATSSHNGGHHYMKYRGGPPKYPGPRRSGGFWANSSLPPRFERSKAEFHAHQFEIDSSCETEELPDGFTKIRSKNLDVLFKKDYYAQRMLLQQQQLAQQQQQQQEGGIMPSTPTSAMSSEQGDEEDTSDPILEEPEGETAQLPQKSVEEPAMETTAAAAADGEEAGEMPLAAAPKKTSKINSNATPFYPSSYLVNGFVPPPDSASAVTSTASDLSALPAAATSGGSGRPNLFLYSPASNTMIPCEEIIIPNAVMPGSSADVYQGPSNIYLAFPMDPTSNSNSAGTNSLSPSSPGTMSTVASPPQVQSPHSNSLSSATPTPVAAAGGAAGGHIVQYDPYGVPYTSYTPTLASAESSSAESTTPQSPPDLSVYNPANWVPSATEGGGYMGGYPQQYYPYYPSYCNYNGRGQYHQYYVENSNLTSSAGESPNEDRSEGEDTPTTTPTTTTTTTSNSPKKEAGARGEATVIPGLPLNNLKRPTKKRRKKKVSSGGATASLTSDGHRGSSSSEANVVQMAAAAITILQRKESLKEESAVEEDTTCPPAAIEADSAITPEEVQQPINDVVSDDPKNVVEAAEEEDEVLTIEKAEDIIQAADTEIVQEAEPVKPSKPRRRRGARKSEKKKLAAASLLAQAEAAVAVEEDQPTSKLEEEEEQHVPEDSHQWETIPQHIIESDDKEGWETTKPKKSIKASLATKPIVAETAEPPREATPPAEPEIAEAAIEEVVEPAEASVEAAIGEAEILATSSAPASRKSTLKRPNRKKRSSLDNSGEVKAVHRPILISDRDFDVASAVAAQRRFNKSALEVLDEAKIRDMAARPTFDTLYVSDIGHGMIGGPISIGRFGLGKYIPPDRSDEVYPIPNGEDASAEATSEAASGGSEDSADDSQKSIIKAMMEEVLKTNASPGSSTLERLTTHIRDAKRFSEISTSLVHNEDTCSSATIPVPEAIVGIKKAASNIDLDLD